MANAVPAAYFVVIYLLGRPNYQQLCIKKNYLLRGGG